MKKIKLNDDTTVRVDHQGFIFFEIDDGEDDAPFECGNIGLGHVIDAIEEALAIRDKSDQSFGIENNTTIEVSLFDNDICLTNNEEDNWWEIVANGEVFLSALKSLVAQ